MIGRILVAAAVVTAAACGGDDPHLTPDAAVLPDATPDAASPRAVAIQFSPTVGTAAFACGQHYEHLGSEDTTISPRDFRFYATDVELLAADGARTPIDLDQDGAWQLGATTLLDFEDFTGDCADGTPETHRAIKGHVPPATYTGLAFTIGVPDDLNHQDLTTQPAPFNVSGLWWSWNLGHIFFAAVSHADLTTPVVGVNDYYFHVGSTGCTGDPANGDTVTCSKPNHPHIELTGFDPTTTPIIVDYGAVLAHSALTSSKGCHSFTEDTCASPFAQVGLDFATGTATTQAVFRIR